jgi:hypothetical protein
VATRALMESAYISIRAAIRPSLSSMCASISSTSFRLMPLLRAMNAP